MKGFVKVPNARTFVNVVQHLRDFEHFEMNKRDLGRQREDQILVAEEDIPFDFILLDWPPKWKTVCKKFYFWMPLIESVAINETNFYSRPNEFVSTN
jgi:hypothetical protein